MKFKNLFLLLVTTTLLFSCFSDDIDDNLSPTSDINRFIWNGMNVAYLYKDQVPNLANSLTNTPELNTFINSFPTPEGLFDAVLTTQLTPSGKKVDPFSFLVDDYIALEQLFSGVTKRSGIEINFYNNPFNAGTVIGVVRLVLPNSFASGTTIKRGDIITAIDGVTLNADNINQLFAPDSYTVTLADYSDNGTPDNADDDTITNNGETITLTKQEYTENPVFITETFNVEGTNIGYLMYNGFTSDFNEQLNAAFSQLAGVDHLVLDLRYNPGGSVNTAVLLGSMITGQFSGQVFNTSQWNEDLQARFESENPDALVNKFTNTLNGSALNSLNLGEVHVITTGSSASASELVINALRPYITVKQVGSTTAGKFQASITLYDSDDFGRQGANPGHTYAIQPLVLKTVNKDGETDYFDGFTPNPDLQIDENFRNYGILGDIDEPLLAKAIEDITGASRAPITTNIEKPLVSSDAFTPHIQEMYIETNFSIKQ